MEVGKFLTPAKTHYFEAWRAIPSKNQGKNTYKIFVVKTENGIQIQKSDFLQSSPADDGLWQPKSRIKPTSISARLGGQNEAGDQSQSKAAISTHPPITLAD